MFFGLRNYLFRVKNVFGIRNYFLGSKNVFGLRNYFFRVKTFFWSQKLFFPKIFLSWGLKTLFASAGGGQESPAGQCWGSLGLAGSRYPRNRFWWSVIRKNLRPKKFLRPKNFFRRKNLGGCNFLLEKRSLVDFQIGNCARANLFGRDAARVFCTQRLQIREDWVLSTQSSPAVCASGGWSRPEDGRVRRIFSARIFSARIWAGATRPGFSLHRDRGFVEIGFYLHRDCRCIGPCGAIIFSPRFARTRRVYVYVYTIEINISNIHHRIVSLCQEVQ